MTGQIILAGVVHIDLHGTRRLKRLLEHYNPDTVSIELGKRPAEILDGSEPTSEEKEIIETYVRYGRLLAEHVNKKTLRAVLDVVNYEYKVSKAYCDALNKPLVFSDCAGVEFLLSCIYQEPELDPCLSFYKTTTSGLTRKNNNLYKKDVIEMPERELKRFRVRERDLHIEEILRAQHGITLHVGGLAHFYGNYFNLYNRLQDLSPIRTNLLAADSL